MASNSYLIEDLGNENFRVNAFDAPVNLHIRRYSNTTRPSASLFPEGFPIWNTDDNFPNYADGADWRDPAGNVT